MSTAGYGLHCKDVPFLDPDALLDLPSSDEAVRDKLKDLLRWTTDASRYSHIEPGPAIRSRIKDRHVALMLKRRKVVRMMRHNAKAFCKAFLVPEHAKGRFRAIEHTKTINEQTVADEKVQFTPFYDRHNAVLKGKYAIDVDWSAFFDQFKLSEDVSPYFSFVVDGGQVYSMNVLPMGLKHSVSIAHTATQQLLNFNPSSYVEAYIDNVRLVSDDREALIRDAATLLTRCARARITVNEADVASLADLPVEEQLAAAVKLAEPLCTQRGPWLGELYDYAAKTIELTDKTRDKVRVCLDAPRPSFRSFAAIAGILQYASRTLGLSLAPYHAARRAISDIAWLLQERPELWDERMPPLCDAVSENLRRWRTDVLAAKPRTMREPEHPELVIIVDASDEGWGALSFDNHGRELHHAEKWSAADKRSFDTRVSTRAEPEGLFRACCRFVSSIGNRNVYIASDSSAATGAVNKGYSLAYWMNHVCNRLQHAFPNVNFHVVHIPGITNPADGISRGAPEPSADDWDRARQIADEARATPIRGAH